MLKILRFALWALFSVALLFTALILVLLGFVRFYFLDGPSSRTEAIIAPFVPQDFSLSWKKVDVHAFNPFLISLSLHDASLEVEGMVRTHIDHGSLRFLPFESLKNRTLVLEDIEVSSANALIHALTPDNSKSSLNFKPEIRNVRLADILVLVASSPSAPAPTKDSSTKDSSTHLFGLKFDASFHTQKAQTENSAEFFTYYEALASYQSIQKDVPTSSLGRFDSQALKGYWEDIASQNDAATLEGYINVSMPQHFEAAHMDHLGADVRVRFDDRIWKEIAPILDAYGINLGAWTSMPIKDAVLNLSIQQSPSKNPKNPTIESNFTLSAEALGWRNLLLEDVHLDVDASAPFSDPYAINFQAHAFNFLIYNRRLKQNIPANLDDLSIQSNPQHLDFSFTSFDQALENLGIHDAIHQESAPFHALKVQKGHWREDGALFDKKAQALGKRLFSGTPKPTQKGTLHHYTLDLPPKDLSWTEAIIAPIVYSFSSRWDPAMQGRIPKDGQSGMLTPYQIYDPITMHAHTERIGGNFFLFTKNNKLLDAHGWIESTIKKDAAFFGSPSLPSFQSLDPIKIAVGIEGLVASMNVDASLMKIKETHQNYIPLPKGEAFFGMRWSSDAVPSAFQLFASAKVNDPVARFDANLNHFTLVSDDTNGMSINLNLSLEGRGTEALQRYWPDALFDYNQIVLPYLRSINDWATHAKLSWHAPTDEAFDDPLLEADFLIEDVGWRFDKVYGTLRNIEATVDYPHIYADVEGFEALDTFSQSASIHLNIHDQKLALQTKILTAISPDLYQIHLPSIGYESLPFDESFDIYGDLEGVLEFDMRFGDGAQNLPPENRLNDQLGFAHLHAALSIDDVLFSYKDLPPFLDEAFLKMDYHFPDSLMLSSVGGAWLGNVLSPEPKGMNWEQEGFLIRPLYQMGLIEDEESQALGLHALLRFPRDWSPLLPQNLKKSDHGNTEKGAKHAMCASLEIDKPSGTLNTLAYAPNLYTIVNQNLWGHLHACMDQSQDMLPSLDFSVHLDAPFASNASVHASRDFSSALMIDAHAQSFSIPGIVSSYQVFADAQAHAKETQAKRSALFDMFDVPLTPNQNPSSSASSSASSTFAPLEPLESLTQDLDALETPTQTPETSSEASSGLKRILLKALEYGGGALSLSIDNFITPIDGYEIHSGDKPSGSQPLSLDVRLLKSDASADNLSIQSSSAWANFELVYDLENDALLMDVPEIRIPRDKATPKLDAPSKNRPSIASTRTNTQTPQLLPYQSSKNIVAFMPQSMGLNVDRVFFGRHPVLEDVRIHTQKNNAQESSTKAATSPLWRMDEFFLALPIHNPHETNKPSGSLWIPSKEATRFTLEGNMDLWDDAHNQSMQTHMALGSSMNNAWIYDLLLLRQGHVALDASWQGAPWDTPLQNTLEGSVNLASSSAVAYDKNEDLAALRLLSFFDFLGLGTLFRREKNQYLTLNFGLDAHLERGIVQIDEDNPAFMDLDFFDAQTYGSVDLASRKLNQHLRATPRIGGVFSFLGLILAPATAGLSASSFLLGALIDHAVSFDFHIGGSFQAVELNGAKLDATDDALLDDESLNAD